MWNRIFWHGRLFAFLHQTHKPQVLPGSIWVLMSRKVITKQKMIKYDPDRFMKEHPSCVELASKRNYGDVKCCHFTTPSICDLLSLFHQNLTWWNHAAIPILQANIECLDLSCRCSVKDADNRFYKRLVQVFDRYRFKDNTAFLWLSSKGWIPEKMYRFSVGVEDTRSQSLYETRGGSAYKWEGCEQFATKQARNILQWNALKFWWQCVMYLYKDPSFNQPAFSRSPIFLVYSIENFFKYCKHFRFYYKMKV